jgi:hypothetical protein
MVPTTTMKIGILQIQMNSKLNSFFFLSIILIVKMTVVQAINKYMDYLSLTSYK